MVAVTAMDTEGLTATQTFIVTVPNRAPVVVDDFPALRLTKGGFRRLSPESRFTDPDGNALVFEAESSDLDVARARVSRHEVLVRAVDAGSVTVTITARDPEGLGAAEEFKVRVKASGGKNPNRPPRIVGSIDDQYLEEGDSITLAADDYFSDPEDDDLKFTAASSDSSVARVTVSGGDVELRAVAEGAATVTITARDPGDSTAVLDFSVTASALPPPGACLDGSADGFHCDGVNLVSRLTPEEIGATGIVNDVWGWTDPSTGTEWALVGHSSGTSFINLKDPAEPVYVGRLPMTSGATANYWRDIKVYRNHAFVVADGAGKRGMQVFDLTRLRNVEDPPPDLFRHQDLHQDPECPQHRDQRSSRAASPTIPPAGEAPGTPTTRCVSSTGARTPNIGTRRCVSEPMRRT